MIAKGTVFGGLSLSFSEPQRFNAEQTTFILAVGQQFAEALERARLYDTERQLRTQSETVQEKLALLADASALLSLSLGWTQVAGWRLA